MPFIMGIAQRMICLDRAASSLGTPAEIRGNRRALAAYPAPARWAV